MTLFHSSSAQYPHFWKQRNKNTYSSVIVKCMQFKPMQNYLFDFNVTYLTAVMLKTCTST